MKEGEIDRIERERRLVLALVAALEDAGRTWDDEVSDILDEYPDETSSLPIRWGESDRPKGWKPPVLGAAHDCGGPVAAQMHVHTLEFLARSSDKVLGAFLRLHEVLHLHENVLSMSSAKPRIARKRRGCCVFLSAD